MLDSAPTGVGTGRHLLKRTALVRTGQCESRLSVPISGLGTFKFRWGRDMLAPRLAQWWVQYSMSMSLGIKYCNYAPKPPTLIIRTRFRKSVGTGTVPYATHSLIRGGMATIMYKSAVIPAVSARVSLVSTNINDTEDFCRPPRICYYASSACICVCTKVCIRNHRLLH